MGTWSAPVDVERLEEFEALVSSPIPANEAPDLLYRSMGDDDLFDMILEAKAIDPATDVRGLVAVKLEEWVNWMNQDDWSNPPSPEIADRLAEILDRIAHHSSSDASVAVRVADGPDAARNNVAWVLELDEDGASKLDVREGPVSGIWIVRTPAGSFYRYNAYTAVVNEAYGTAKDRIEALTVREMAPGPMAGAGKP